MAHETKNRVAEAQDEELLKKIADGEVKIDIPRDGHPLPEGYDNPPAGTQGHRCVDPQGIYRKDWFCLKLHKTDGMPTRQPFNCAGKKYRVLVGQWVDVPPSIVSVLSMAVVQSVRYGYDMADPLGAAEVQEIVDETPRFSYSVIPSA